MLDVQGTWTALITPFRDDVFDEDALRKIVAQQIEGGVDGLVPCGTTGESVNLTEDEYAAVIRAVVQEARGKIPVIAGAGTASTRHTIELSKIALKQGAVGTLLVCPYYNRPTQSGLEAHFRAVLKEVAAPTVLYNIPTRTGCDLAIETLERLSDVKHIVAMKEATGNVARAQQIVARFGDRFSVLSGDDSLTLSVLSVGGKGVISVASNVVPKPVSSVVSLWREGSVRAAQELHLILCRVYDALFIETNPGPIKAALAIKGMIAPEIRLPLVWPNEASLARIREALATVIPDKSVSL